MGAAGLPGHDRARPARGGAQLLRARAVVEGLPAHPATRIGAPRAGRVRLVTLAPRTARRVVLWRHGQTVWNAENRFQGQTDVPLDEVGVQQAGRAARLLAALAPNLIVSSDLRRAVDTATPLADILGQSVLVDAGLRETHGGRWEGQVAQQILALDGDAYQAWQRGEDVRAGTTGERRSEVAERAVG